MLKKRLIARLDIKNDFVIKGIQLEGLRKVGNPNILAKKYYNDGIDEIIFIDAVASYYDRNSLSNIIIKAVKNVFVPLTVGGGIRKIEDIQIALNSGADKVSINTQAVKDPGFIKNASKTFGSQCIVSSIEAKNVGKDKWEVYVDNGREPTGLDVLDWSKEVEQLGAGEIFLTSIDKDGTKRGFDTKLCDLISENINIPLIFSGGCGNSNHIIDLLNSSNPDAISLGSILHYEICTIKEIKEELIKNNFEVRYVS